MSTKTDKNAEKSMNIFEQDIYPSQKMVAGPLHTDKCELMAKTDDPIDLLFCFTLDKEEKVNFY